MKKRTNTGLPKVGSVADHKRQNAFENRTISPLKAVAEGVAEGISEGLAETEGAEGAETEE